MAGFVVPTVILAATLCSAALLVIFQGKLAAFSHSLERHACD